MGYFSNAALMQAETDDKFNTPERAPGFDEDGYCPQCPEPTEESPMTKPTPHPLQSLQSSHCRICDGPLYVLRTWNDLFTHAFCRMVGR